MHHVGRLDPASMSTPDAYRGRSLGFRRQSLIDGLAGSVHMGFGACELSPEGHLGGHVHSYEEAFYVLEGTPQLAMGGETFELAPQQCGLIPLGVPHAWRNRGARACRWLVTSTRSPPTPSSRRSPRSARARARSTSATRAAGTSSASTRGRWTWTG